MTNDLINDPQAVPTALDFSNVDATTRERIGSLCAHGLSDLQIADILLLTQEQVAACHNSDEFKKKYAEVAEEQIQRQIDLAEGYDAVETQGLKQILDTLQYNRDPKFALAAVQIANRAIRRKAGQKDQIVVDGSKPQSNVIILQLNKTYINNAQKGESAMIDVSARQIDQPQRRSDLPSPKLVDQMLAPVRQNGPAKKMTEMEEAFAAAGVVFDKAPE